MTGNNQASDPTTREEFERAIDALARRAHANGVEVENGIDLRHPGEDVPDWSVEIIRLMKDSEFERR